MAETYSQSENIPYDPQSPGGFAYTGPAESSPVYSQLNPTANTTNTAGTVEMLGGNLIKMNYPPGTNFTLGYSYHFMEPMITVKKYLGGASNEDADVELIQASQGGVFGPPAPGGGTSTNVDPGSPKWTHQSRLRNIPYMIFKINPDPDVFPRQLEDITCQVAGKYDILDTRTGTLGYTENPMLIARDYAINECGVQAGDIDYNLFNANVNICEEAIQLPAGAPNMMGPEYPQYSNSNLHEMRYRCHILLNTEAKPLDNLASILSSCDGSAVMSGGSFDLRAGAFEDPPDVNQFDESDIVSPPQVTITPPVGEVFNGVRGRFQDARVFKWPLSELPGYTSETYLSHDKRTKDKADIREYDLQGTNSLYMGQRIIKQMLHRARQFLKCTVTFNIKAMMLAPEMTIFLTVKSLGWEMKCFRVKALRLATPVTFEVELHEDVPDVYRYDYREEIFDPAPNTTLQNMRLVPSIGPLSFITNSAAAAFGNDGELHPQCVVSWGAVTDPLVLARGYIELQYRRSTDSELSNAPRLSPYKRNFRFPIERGDQLYVRARLSNGYVAGPWSDQRTIANDTPTQHMIGENLIRNPGFIFYDAGNNVRMHAGWMANPNVAPYAVYDNPTNVIPVITSGGFPPYSQLTTSRHLTQAVQLPGEEDYTGYVAYWCYGNYVTYLRIESIAVVPNQRYAIYAYAYCLPEMSTIARIYVYWRDAQGTILDQASTPNALAWMPHTAPTPVARDMTIFRFMARAPSNCLSATLTLEAKNISGLAQSHIIWNKPMFTPASEGQIDYPIWRAS